MNLVLILAGIVLLILLMVWQLQKLGEERGRNESLESSLDQATTRLKELAKRLPTHDDMLRWMRKYRD
jgi:cytochrome oxidase assembly protein ShyY1